ncbi:1-acyl-sn-glycerol-3-phosphate acyltransferase [Aneurinibacillus sp. REN35]|uniref:1-acyl-sn-glycerol-3-phosphate acyltransferase n=1 Tax=Aneurinibacillus sp. REN35 TaxID=3237286 RepID=UPI0035288CDD
MGREGYGLAVLWLHAIRTWLARIYFRKIRVYGTDHLPKQGMTLFVSNHRNGAIDGYVLLTALPACRAIVGRNLTGSWFLRLFFGGQIEVYRKAEEPEQKAWNRDRMQEAVAAMRHGVPVLIFPEGTSELGPKLLPIKKGAAFMCHTLLEEAEEGEALSIVPLGLHYEEGWRFRSAAEIHIGTPIRLTKASARNITKLTETIRESLADISENFADVEEQRIGEAFASLLRYHGVTRLSHLALCRMWAARKMSTAQSEEFLQIHQSEVPARYQGVPLFGQYGTWSFALSYCLLTLLVLLFCILNGLPLVGGYVAAKKMADDTNVIALWRILVGTPLFLLQLVCYILLSLLLFSLPTAGLLMGVYAAITAAGIGAWDAWRRAGVRARNRSSTQRRTILSFCERFKT